MGNLQLESDGRVSFEKVQRGGDDRIRLYVDFNLEMESDLGLTKAEIPIRSIYSKRTRIMRPQDNFEG